MGIFCRGMVALILTLTPVAGLAQDRDSETFVIYFRGIKGAKLDFSAIEQNGRYSAASLVRSSGVVGAFRTITYEAKSQGRARSNGRYTPSLYVETRNNRGAIRTARMPYRNGIPQGRELDPPRPPRPNALDPTTQGGTWDVMTAIFAVFRDKPVAQVCDVNQYLFDGRRRMRLSMQATQSSADKITCSATYERIAGYSNSELEDGTRFPFTMTYEPNGNGEWHVTRVDMSTIYGTGYMVRR